ncbi:metallophosphoesterase [Paludisphaera soli]|uniref:metallophosphoesterase n=1 Tax=Paludisphaera soli TaxID=2712865 RepID=UPI0013EC0617|nr:metallophosphoesterase [Paludisphaera soli]
MPLPDELDYPIIAIGDLHGRREELQRLVGALERRPEWADCALVFLGDFVDRGPDSRGTIDLVLELLRRPTGGSAVMGNHDLALIRSARLDGGPPSPYWPSRYQDVYDGGPTFESYLGRPARPGDVGFQDDLDAFRAAIPDEHRAFLAGLRWVVEAPGHLFLHCGLSPELGAGPVEQVAALRARRWDRSTLRPREGSITAMLWEDEYPVWLGADRTLSDRPLAYPGKVQVTGHDRVAEPSADAVRIRLDTSGGFGEPTACLLTAADAPPVFIRG